MKGHHSPQLRVTVELSPADIWMGQVPSVRRSSPDGNGVKGDKDRGTESTPGRATRWSGGWGAEWARPEVERHVGRVCSVLRWEGWIPRCWGADEDVSKADRVRFVWKSHSGRGGHQAQKIQAWRSTGQYRRNRAT